MSSSTFSPHRKRGFTLVAVLSVSALLTLIVHGLFFEARLSAQIAENSIRLTKATMAATSGLNHFMSMNISIGTVSNRLRSNPGASETILDDVVLERGRLFYTVKVSACCSATGGFLPRDTLRVESTGVYRKGEKIWAKKTISATIKAISE